MTEQEEAELDALKIKELERLRREEQERQELQQRMKDSYNSMVGIEMLVAGVSLVLLLWFFNSMFEAQADLFDALTRYR